MILVLAGKYDEIRFWLRQQPGLTPKDIKAIFSTHDIQGCYRPIVALVGQYWRHPDHRELKDYLDAQRAIYITQWRD